MNKEMSPYSQYIAKSRYARWIPAENRREDWSETVHRYINFFAPKIPEQDRVTTANEIEQAILSLEVMPSMRALMTAGPALEKDNVAGFNCSYVTIDDPRAFDEAMYISMCGTGVGFSVERQYTNQLPTVAENFYSCDTVIKVRDSKIGWANAFRQLLALLYGGSIPKWDLSALRPAGAILKTFGGRSSGPEPLDRLFKFAVRMFQGAAGRKLTSLECHDLMCMIADIVVSGGVRRSAMISLSNLSDDRMRNAKNGQWWIENDQRRLANNTAVYTEKPEIGVFMKEWLTLYESRSGERGIFNREGAKKHAHKNGRRKTESIDFGTNPCQPEFASVLTPNGIRKLKDIDVGSVVWSGNQWTKVSAKWSTGIKEVFKYETRAGNFIGTSNHRVVSEGVKIEAEDAESIDISYNKNSYDFSTPNPQDVLDGVVFGDGYVHHASNDLALLCIGSKDGDYHNSEIKPLIGKYRPGVGSDAWEVNTTVRDCLFKKTYDRVIPDRFYTGDLTKVAGFLRGLFTANGSIAGKRVTLKQTSFTVIRQVQEMLSFLGIRSYYTVNKAKEINWSNGTYTSKQSYDLNISGSDREVFKKAIGFIQAYKNQRLEEITSRPTREVGRKSTYEVVGSESLGFHEVFDLTVEADEHTYWTGGLLVSNCGEILLRPKGFCNLSEVVIRPHDTKKTLKEKIRKAVIIGTLQSTLTDFRYLRKEWQKNAEEERLLGVSLTGIMDNKLTSTNGPELEKLLDDLREYAIEVNKEWAEKLGINPATAITCVKPSGTVSQLVDSSSGIHSRYAKFIERAVREDRKNPVGTFLKQAGVKNEPDVTKPKDVDVFYFPLKSPEASVCRNDLTAIQQLEIYLTYKIHWTEHNPSCTIYVRESEWLEVASWVYKHFDSIGGVSFLPHTDHIYKQAPYSEITEEEYNSLVQKMPKIDWSLLQNIELEDRTTAMKELACSSGVCEYDAPETT